MGELDPVAADQVGDFVMAWADLDVLSSSFRFRSANPVTLSNMRTALGGAKSSLNSMVNSMATIGILTGTMGEDAAKIVATVQLVSGGAQILSALRALYEIKAVAKVAEGIAHLSKYAVAAPVVAGIAIGAAAVYEGMIKDQVEQYNFFGDYSSPSGIRLMQNQLASTGVSL